MPLPEQKIFAIGDIHGCQKALRKLLSHLPFDKENDILVFLGDYINRGTDSKQVVETLLELKATCAHIVFLKGNHEQMLLEYAESGDVEMLRLLQMMGIEATVASYGITIRKLRELDGLPSDHRHFLQTLEFAYVAGKYIFTHADIDEAVIDLALAGTTFPAPHHHAEAGLLCSRRLNQGDTAIDEYTVIFGHTPYASPLVLADRICIDTGAVYGNILTAVELPSMLFHHG